MTRVTFAIGQADIPDLEAKRLQAYHHASELFGGFTATLGFGGWIDPRGNLVLEESLTLVCYVADSDLGRVDACSSFLQVLFSQECVLVARDAVQVTFTEAIPVAA